VTTTTTRYSFDRDTIIISRLTGQKKVSNTITYNGRIGAIVTTNNEQDIYDWWHKIQKTTKRGGNDIDVDSSEVDGPSSCFVIPIVINEEDKRISFY
jgi:ACT domain-containing protein